MSDILTLIDRIDVTTEYAELDVMTSLMNSYMKEAQMIQEGVLDEVNSPVLGDKSESMLKRILMFIPRVIAKIIRMLVRLVKTFKRRKTIFSKEFNEIAKDVAHFESVQDAEDYLKAKGLGQKYEIRESNRIQVKRIRQRGEIFYVIEHGFGAEYWIAPHIMLDAPVNVKQDPDYPGEFTEKWFPSAILNITEEIYAAIKNIFGLPVSEISPSDTLPLIERIENTTNKFTWKLMDIDISFESNWFNSEDDDLEKTISVMNDINLEIKRHGMSIEDLAKKGSLSVAQNAFAGLNATLLGLSAHIAKWSQLVQDIDDAIGKVIKELKTTSKAKEIINDIKNA